MTSAGSATVSRVLRGELCTGCGLCAAMAPGEIEMRVVEPGYRRPYVKGKVSSRSEQLIATACPGSVVAPWPATPPPHPYWGGALTVATGHAIDPQVRFQASSGGVISALLIHALRSGQVDRVIHVAADPERHTENIVVCSTTEAQILEGAGSRYSSSSPLADIENILGQGGAAAFVGKPCDVSGLRQLARQDPRVDAHIPLMLSFFCGGIPSDAGAGRMLAAMEVAPEELTAFRYRGFGWPGLASATTRDGKVSTMSYAESWGDFLSHEVQFRCKICPDAVGAVADIACGDAWYGGDKGYPAFDEEDGRSLVITRTTAGETLLRAAILTNAISIAPLDQAEIDLMQPAQARRKRLILARTAAASAALQPSLGMAGTRVRDAAKRAGFGEQVRNFLGTFRRIITGRR